MTDTDTKTQAPALRQAQDASCRHHWLLGQPEAGQIKAVCKICGGIRVYPAVLDDLDPGIETETRNPSERVATAAGGARPSSTALRQAGSPKESGVLRTGHGLADRSRNVI